MRTLFKGGFIADGTGAPVYKGDLLVEDGRIVAVGGPGDVAADEVLACAGLVVAPGFIDAHSHNDFFYDREDAEQF